MPPSCPGSVSGVWRTAQRTIRNSAQIGIFRITISQMKVQVVTHSIVYPVADPHKLRIRQSGLAARRLQGRVFAAWR